MKEANFIMVSNPQDNKAALQAENGLNRMANQFAREAGQQMKSLKRQKELKQRNSIIDRMVKIMLDNGASNRSILKALPGLAEFAKFGSRAVDNPASGKPDNSQPQPTPGEEVLGLFLSEVETQEVRWLWEKHIPLGKITILDGDPAMGKSLLAINVAACVSTG
ncbi:MAG TPA: AAA family ATPase, partial [Ktedonobacteraceae bacterium]|nr:AAA family ATPase [Ktedonobacteraceae bacterium]